MFFSFRQIGGVHKYPNVYGKFKRNDLFNRRKRSFLEQEDIFFHQKKRKFLTYQELQLVLTG
ncbi:hypothetical protein PsAD13_01619 [Pseudovibrio sp. Ad13]|nr:hypothetical protein PsAD13_01619 [Pseudovibrio sp. Ad13]